MMAEALMTYETIDSAQIDDIMAGKKPGPPGDWGRMAAAARRRSAQPEPPADADGKEDKPDDPVGDISSTKTV